MKKLKIVKTQSNLNLSKLDIIAYSIYSEEMRNQNLIAHEKWFVDNKNSYQEYYNKAVYYLRKKIRLIIWVLQLKCVFLCYKLL